MVFALSSHQSDMFRVVTLIAVLSWASVLGACAPPRHPLGGRIVGGTEVAIQQVPFQLSYEKFEAHWCGASVIGVEWAATAAHCAQGVQVSDVRLRSGTDIREEGGEIHEITRIIIHERYDSWNYDYDIALLQVATPFVMSSTTAVVPLASVAPPAGTASVVSGWGATVSGGTQLPRALRWVEVPIYDQDDCDWEYEDYGGVTSRMICAGVATGGKDSCQGDSGGPLTVEGTLVGIVSWGIGCALAGYPGVYTNVAMLRSWIADQTGI